MSRLASRTYSSRICHISPRHLLRRLLVCGREFGRNQRVDVVHSHVHFTAFGRASFCAQLLIWIFSLLTVRPWHVLDSLQSCCLLKLVGVVRFLVLVWVDAATDFWSWGLRTGWERRHKRVRHASKLRAFLRAFQIRPIVVNSLRIRLTLL